MSNLTPRPDSEAEWTKLMQQLRLQSQAEPRPFFYARVRARCLASAAPRPAPWLPAWLWRPAYAAVLGALVLAVSGDGAAPVGHRQASYSVQQLP